MVTFGSKKRGLTIAKLGLVISFLKDLPKGEIVSVSEFSRTLGMHPDDGKFFIDFYVTVQESPKIRVQKTGKATYISLKEEHEDDGFVLAKVKKLDRKVGTLNKTVQQIVKAKKVIS